MKNKSTNYKSSLRSSNTSYKHYSIFDVLPWFMIVVPDKTKCKHKTGNCIDCGTNDETDAIHTTQNGVGKVGKLFKK